MNDETKVIRPRRRPLHPPRPVDIRALLTATLILASVLALMAWALALQGCATLSSSITPAGTPTCAEMESHVIDIGCEDDPVCERVVTTIKNNVISRVPQGVPFDEYCQLALTAFPFKCAMSAENPKQLLDCLE